MNRKPLSELKRVYSINVKWSELRWFASQAKGVLSSVKWVLLKGSLKSVFYSFWFAFSYTASDMLEAKTVSFHSICKKL